MPVYPSHGLEGWDDDLKAYIDGVVGTATSATISDATTVGKAVLTATDAAAARTAISATSTSDVDARVATALATAATGGGTYRPIVVLEATDPTPNPASYADGTVFIRKTASGAITVGMLASGTDGTDATSYATSSFAPGTNTMYILCVHAGRTDGTAATPSSISGGATTWTQIATIANTAGNEKTTVYKGTGTLSTGAVTINFSGAQHNCIWYVLGIKNASTTIVQSNTAVSASSGTISVALTGASSANTVIGFVSAQSTSQTITAGTGFTELGTQISNNTPSVLAECEYTSTGTTPVSWTVSSTAQKTMVALELST